MTVGVSAVNTANAWLNVLRGGGVGTTFTAAATLFVQLHTADPGAAGTTAVSVGSATRNAVTQGAAASGVQANSAAPSAWTNGGTSEAISHLSVWDASSGGNFLFSVALTSSQAWVSTNTLTVTSLTLTYSPLAA